MLYSLIHHITCRIEARQALIYQLVSGLTGENGKYNDAKAVHFYPPFFDIFCSPKNNKTVSALTDGSIVNMGLKDARGNICYVIGVTKAIREQLGKKDGGILHVVIEER